MIECEIINISITNQLIIKNLTNLSARTVLPEKQGLRQLIVLPITSIVIEGQNGTSRKTRIKTFD